MTTTTHGYPLTPYAEHRDRFLRHAAEQIEAGDRLQASEKLWGAVSHGIKAMAARRGWPVDSHQAGRNVVDYVAYHADKPDLIGLYAVIEALHVNFYKDEHEIDQIAQRLQHAERFLAELAEADARLPRLPAPAVARRQRQPVVDALKGMGYSESAAQDMGGGMQKTRFRSPRQRVEMDVEGGTLVWESDGAVTVTPATGQLPPPAGNDPGARIEGA